MMQWRLIEVCLPGACPMIMQLWQKVVSPHTWTVAVLRRLCSRICGVCAIPARLDAGWLGLARSVDGCQLIFHSFIRQLCMPFRRLCHKQHGQALVLSSLSGPPLASVGERCQRPQARGERVGASGMLLIEKRRVRAGGEPGADLRGQRGWDDMFEERDVWSLKVR